VQNNDSYTLLSVEHGLNLLDVREKVHRLQGIVECIPLHFRLAFRKKKKSTLLFFIFVQFCRYHNKPSYCVQDVLRRRRSRKGDAGFSLTFAAFAGLIGLMVGLLMSLIFSSAPADA
jgi:hypothetical protein